MRLVLLITAFLLAACAEDYTHTKNTKKDTYLTDAESGNPYAQFKHGQHLCCNPEDDGEAMHWLCRSARQGHTPAMHLIASLYRTDKQRAYPKPNVEFTTVPEDDALAYAWYRIAELQGYQFATINRKALEKDLMPWELKNAQHWVDHYPDLPCEIAPVDNPQPEFSSIRKK